MTGMVTLFNNGLTFSRFKWGASVKDNLIGRIYVAVAFSTTICLMDLFLRLAWFFISCPYCFGTGIVASEHFDTVEIPWKISWGLLHVLIPTAAIIFHDAADKTLKIVK